jgi:hypothetical protein
VIFTEAEDDARWTLSAHRLGLHPVLTAKANRCRVIVQLIELHREALPDREHDGGEERAPVGIVEPIEGSAESIIACPRSCSARPYMDGAKPCTVST